MDNKLCFDKNTFIIGIIIIIIIIFILSYFINFNYENNSDANIHNLINKKILNIKDKIINNYTIIEKNKQNKLQENKECDCELKENKIPELQENKIPELQENKIPELQENKIPELQENKYTEIPNDKKDDKNNINNRINERDDLIKYKLDNIIEQRDLNVLLNPIYPPLGRVERPAFDNLIKMNFGQTTRGSESTFRLIGYLVNTNKNDIDMGNNIWKLFGRQLYKNSNIGEFYVSPVNSNKSEMKIFLKNEMMTKEKIRDIYALPNEVYLDAPFFSKSPYTLNELPKPDLNSNYL